ncbi:MAG: hypothetical protein AAF892_11830 [Cyanobacteria bacterium P01_D01_bin.71]
MVEWLTIWGVAALSVFRPILEDIAKDVAKDAAKSYVGQCFKSVFSVIYKEPLTKATGQALKELLQLIEDELIRADIEEERLKGWVLMCSSSYIRSRCGMPSLLCFCSLTIISTPKFS